MIRFNQAVPSLVQGVSQQSPSVRRPGHASVQQNAVSDPVLGLTKRAGTVMQAATSFRLAKRPWFYWYERGAERWCLVFDGVELKVYDHLGRGYTVEVESGLEYLAQAVTPELDLHAVTLNDQTIIANRRVTVSMSESTTAARPNEGLAWIKTAALNQKYIVKINGSTWTHTVAATGDPPLTSDVAEALEFAMTDGGALAAAVSGASASHTSGESLIRIERSSGSALKISGADSQGNSSVKAFSDRVDSFDDLPSRAWDGLKVLVTGLAEEEQDDYWVEFAAEDTTTTLSNGVWYESNAPGIPFELDPATMPVALTRTEDESGNIYFVLSTINWSDREVGDETTNPDPSFVGGEITAMALVQGRLLFVSGDSLSFSSTDDVYNFFRSTVTAVPDSDRIDISVANAKGGSFYWCVPFGNELMLLGDTYQASVLLDPPLSAKTIQLIDSASLELDRLAQPAKTNRTLFLSERNGARYSAVREMYGVGDGLKDSSLIVELVPDYIRGRIIRMETSSVLSTLFVLSDADRSDLYVYRFMDSGGQRVQAAWSMWTFHEAQILSFRVYDDSITFVMQRRGAPVTFESMPLEPDEELYAGYGRIHLDRAVTTTVPEDLEQPETLGNLRVSSNSTDQEIAVGAAVSLPTIEEGDPAPTLVVRLTNNGLDDIVVSSVYLSSTDWSVETDPMPVTLAPAETATFTLTLDATAVGSYSSSVSIFSNDADAPVYSFAVLGTIEAADPVDPPSPPWFDIGDPSEIGSPSSVTIFAPVVPAPEAGTVDISLPYAAVEGRTVVVDVETGSLLDWVRYGDDTVIRVSGAERSHRLIVGDLFDMFYWFSPVKLIRSNPEGGAAPLSGGRLDLMLWRVVAWGQDFVLRAFDSRYGRYGSEKTVPVYRVGNRSAPRTVRRVVAELSIMLPAETTCVEVKSVSAFPLRLEAAEWEGLWSGDGRP